MTRPKAAEPPTQREPEEGVYCENCVRLTDELTKLYLGATEHVKTIQLARQLLARYSAELTGKDTMGEGTIDQAVMRWVNAKKEQVLREDCKGDLQLAVRTAERDVEDAIYEELEAAEAAAALGADPGRGEG